MKEDTRQMIIRRVMKVKGTSLTDIYKQIPREETEARQAVKDFVNTAPLLLKRIIHPLEDAIHDFAVNASWSSQSLCLDNDAEVQRMRKEVENAIRGIQQTGDEDELGKLKAQLGKLKDIDNISSAAEGFVFNYDGIIIVHW